MGSVIKPTNEQNNYDKILGMVHVLHQGIVILCAAFILCMKKIKMQYPFIVDSSVVPVHCKYLNTSVIDKNDMG